ncbi:NAD(P)H-binding protein [Streptomyces otsuchiensis]|uniref:NAD(P)H-binding protein n=3 Tax=Streptomyces TaxID=1883 RepID=UPI001D131745|nr:NAD(P)H-binding protein [Streptomyces otsuchiensis]
MNTEADSAGAAPGDGRPRLMDCAVIARDAALARAAQAGGDGATGGRVLVLGATGKSGRRVVGRLRARRTPLRIGSRSAQAAPFDWADPAGWPAALADIDAVYVAYAPDLSDPAAPGRLAALSRAAAESGARRLVLLSGRGMSTARRAEDAVREALEGTGTAWTMLRACWFAQNFSEDSLLPEVLSGVVTIPAGEVPEPFVDLADVADVAVAALTEAGHEGETYTLTGSRALTFREAVAEIARVSGLELRYRPVPAARYAEAMSRRGMAPAAVAAAMLTLTETLDGSCSEPADGVRRALGHEARDFEEFVRRTAASGAWED